MTSTSNDFRALKPYRHCYELDSNGEPVLFWLSPEGERTPIVPFGATLETLRKIGYRMPNESEETRDADRKGRDRDL